MPTENDPQKAGENVAPAHRRYEPRKTKENQGKPRKTKESIMTKIILALTLALATLVATVPASALAPCQDDLGYGRTSMGCGG